MNTSFAQLFSNPSFFWQTNTRTLGRPASHLSSKCTLELLTLPTPYYSYINHETSKEQIYKSEATHEKSRGEIKGKKKKLMGVEGECVDQ